MPLLFWLMIWPIPRWRILIRQPPPYQEEAYRRQRVHDRKKNEKKKKTQSKRLCGVFFSFFIRTLPQRFSLAQLRHPSSVGALYILNLWTHTVPCAGAVRRGLLPSGPISRARSPAGRVVNAP